MNTETEGAGETCEKREREEKGIGKKHFLLLHIFFCTAAVFLSQSPLVSFCSFGTLFFPSSSLSLCWCLFVDAMTFYLAPSPCQKCQIVQHFRIKYLQKQMTLSPASIVLVLISKS